MANIYIEIKIGSSPKLDRTCGSGYHFSDGDPDTKVDHHMLLEELQEVIEAYLEGKWPHPIKLS